MIKAILALLTALPEILKLIKRLQDEHKKASTNRKIRDDLQIIDKAFATRDSNLLSDLFNGVPNSGEAKSSRGEAQD